MLLSKDKSLTASHAGVTGDLVTLCWAQRLVEENGRLVSFEWPIILKEWIGFVRAHGVEAQEGRHRGAYMGMIPPKAMNLEKKRWPRVSMYLIPC